MALTTATMIALASAAFGAVGQISSGRAAQKAADVQSELFLREAARDREIAGINATRIAREGAALAGRQRALLAGQGRDISTGSALLIQTDLAEKVEFEKRLTKAGGEAQAGVSEARAAISKAEGRTALKSSLFRAGASLLKGGSAVAKGFG